MKPSDRENDEAPPDVLVSERALRLADASTTRAAEQLAEKALEQTGHVARAANAVAAGVPPGVAVQKVVPMARGIVAEESLAAVYNRDAGLVDGPLTASRFEITNDPTCDVVVRDGTGGLVKGYQLKFGKPAYVTRAVASGKYAEPVVTSTETLQALEDHSCRPHVTDTIEAGRVTSDSLSDTEMATRTRRALERRFLRVRSLSSWQRLEQAVVESAPAGLGAAAVAAVHETYRAASTGEPLKADRVLRASLKSGVRAMAVDQVGRLLMGWFEQVVLKGDAWTQTAVKRVAGFATPAAALASLIVDVVLAAVDWLRGKISGDDFWRHVAGKIGAVALSALLTALGFYVGSFVGPLPAFVLAGIGGYYGAVYGERVAHEVYDRVYDRPVSIAGTEVPA